MDMLWIMVKLEFLCSCFLRFAGVGAVGSALTKNEPHRTGVFSGWTEDPYPFVKCGWRSDDKDLIALAILDETSKQDIVSLALKTKECVTSVNVQAKIECSSLGDTTQVYAELRNLTVGETRIYSCKRTYFDDKIFYEYEQLKFTVSKGPADTRTSGPADTRTSGPADTRTSERWSPRAPVYALMSVLVVLMVSWCVCYYWMCILYRRQRRRFHTLFRTETQERLAAAGPAAAEPMPMPESSRVETSELL